MPLPDIPFRNVLNSQEKALKKKEKGPWEQLSPEEKLSLYSIKFNLPFDKTKGPRNKWKTIIVAVGFYFATVFSLYWIREDVFPTVPHTGTDDRTVFSPLMLLDMRFRPIHGLSSNLDYEKNEWNKPRTCKEPDPSQQNLCRQPNHSVPCTSSPAGHK